MGHKGNFDRKLLMKHNKLYIRFITLWNNK